MFELYEKFIESYKSGNEDAFNAAARNFIEAAEENPFQTNTKEHDLFFKAKSNNKRWHRGGIDMRVSKRTMYQLLNQLAELNIENPYKKVEKKIEKKEKTEDKQPQVILGVVPEKKRRLSFFKKEGAKNDGQGTN